MDNDEQRPLLQGFPPPLTINTPCGGSSTPDDIEYSPTPSGSSVIVTPRGRGRFFFVELTLMLFFLSDYPMGLVIQKYVVDWTTRELLVEYNVTHDVTDNVTAGPCDVNASSGDNLFHQAVQQRASMFSAVEAVGRGVPAVISLLVLGSSSDLIGRRLAILPPMFGLVFYCATVATIIYYQLSGWFLFVGDIVFGACGSYNGMIMGCNAYVADTTPATRMTIRLNVIGFCVMVPIFVAAETIGFLLERLGYTGAVLVFLAIAATNITYVAIFLQNPQRAIAPVNAAEGDVVIVIKTKSISERIGEHVKKTTTLFYSPTFDTVVNRNTKLYLLLSILVVTNIAAADSSFFVLFELNSPLCWSVQMIGIFSGIMVATYAFGALIVTRVQKCCMSDHSIAIMALIATTTACFYKFFVTSTVMMFLVASLGVFMLQYIPCIKSMLSALVGRSSQGALFGLTGSIDVIFGVIGTVTMNTIYAKTLHITPGFIFLIQASIFLVACFLLVAYIVLVKTEPSSTVAPPNESDDMRTKYNTEDVLNS